MACCVIAALILLVMQRLTPWRRRTPDVAGFAPVATRPAPGQGVDLAPPLSALTSPPPPPLRRGVAMSAWVLRFVSVGACAYLAVVGVLLSLGAARSGAPFGAWVLRTVFVVSVAIIAGVLASQVFRRGEDRLSRREVVGCAAVGIGLVFLERTVVEMDLLSLYSAASPVLGYAFHVVSIAALVAGVVVVLSGQRAEIRSRVVLGG